MTTKKFKSLQEPVWIVEMNGGTLGWLQCLNCTGNTKQECLDLIASDAMEHEYDIDHTQYRFRRYVPAPARKTRKK